MGRIRVWFGTVGLVGALLIVGYGAEARHCSNIAIVVLGTRPLDATTPSVDMERRAEMSVPLHAQYPTAVLVFTGGQTGGPVSEARMMAGIAREHGLPPGSYILLEERARSTEENAEFTAALLGGCGVKRTLLVTRPGHIGRATRVFSAYSAFGRLEPMPTRITKEEILKNLRGYLKEHKSEFVVSLIKKISHEPGV